MSNFSFMKPIDAFILKHIETLVENPKYKSFLDGYNHWDEKLQTLLKLSLLSIVILIPCIIASVFYFISSSANEKLNVNKDLITITTEILAQDAEMNAHARKYIGKKNLNSKEAFESEIKRSLSNARIEANKISIGDFSNDSISKFDTISTELKFKELSSDNFFAFMNTLGIQNRIKFEDISIKKNTITNLLEGVVTVRYLSVRLAEDI